MTQGKTSLRFTMTTELPWAQRNKNNIYKQVGISFSDLLEYTSQLNNKLTASLVLLIWHFSPSSERKRRNMATEADSMLISSHKLDYTFLFLLNSPKTWILNQCWKKNCFLPINSPEFIYIIFWLFHTFSNHLSNFILE